MPDRDLEKFCFFPFTQLLLQPNGSVSPCCWNQQIILGEMPRESLAEIWNGEAIRSLRREFLEQRPVSCQTQMSEIGCHRWSQRPAWKTDPSLYQERQSTYPRRLDLRLNGKCNLQCVMCDVWQQPNGVYDDSDLWTRGPQEIFPFLEEIDMLGGEPFVQADTYRLISQVSACNSACSWAFVTNGHFRFNQKIRSMLEGIPIRWMQVSIDSMDPENYSRIRVKGELARALETLHALRRYRAERLLASGRFFRLYLGMCVQKGNWQDIAPYLDFAKSISVEVHLQFAYEPDQFSLLKLERSQREEVTAHFRELRDKYGDEQIRSVLLPMEASLQ